jgi:1-deoxy-D-xylulose-5-phosphate synthase
LLLHGLTSPDVLKALDEQKLPQLADDIRKFLIEKVTQTGGHLGPNLGVVELTIALHRVFDSPKDVMVFDTGHQSYVHKILTGRAKDFDTLRQEGGLSGYPSRAESIHDVVENSHASTALSYADGVAKAFQQFGESKDRHVVAVIGDGALTGGMTWEALNNIADAQDRPLVIVVNDNGRSYSPTIGGLAHHLLTLRTTKGYEKFLEWGKDVLVRTSAGKPIFDALHGMKKGIKDIVAPQGLFEDLGLKYIGPIDGHNISDLQFALKRAKEYEHPVIVHVITEKGRGYKPAENDEAERFHAVGIVDPETGIPIQNGGRTWTKVFSEEIVEIAKDNQQVVAITAAMLGPTGLDKFKKEFPNRLFDVGIAEQHAATSAAGMAYAGLHPVVAIYATFLNRAFDQVLMDIALHKAGVTFVLDRAGVTGDDGASHNGMWDLSLLQIVPGLHLAAPRDENTLRKALQEAVKISDAPSVVRFPKGALSEPIAALSQYRSVDILLGELLGDVLIVSVGPMAQIAIDTANLLSAKGLKVSVVDPRWVKPINEDLIELAKNFTHVATIEDGVKAGGVGSAISSKLREKISTWSTMEFGLPTTFLDHAKRNNILKKYGLTAESISAQILDKTKSTSIS